MTQKDTFKGYLCKLVVKEVVWEGENFKVIITKITLII